MPTTISAPLELSRLARLAVLAAAFLGLLFDGFELGLMPVASRSVTQGLSGANFTEVENVRWFVVLFKEHDGPIITRSEAKIDSIDGCDDPATALSISGKARSAGFGNLQQDDAFPQFWL